MWRATETETEGGGHCGDSNGNGGACKSQRGRPGLDK